MRWSLSCGPQLRVSVLSYGAIVDAIDVPDARGVVANVALSYADPATYAENNDPYFGAIVGRYANRIAAGRFTLDGRTYDLSRNDGAQTLHGGADGFDRREWQLVEASPSALVLSLISPDGDQGFPGRLDVRVRYEIRADDPGALRIGYRATTDAPTVVNLTHHGYINLAGESSGTIADHELTLHASAYTPVDAQLIPTGEIAPVAGTPFDFRTPRRIGDRLRDGHPQLVRALGYDHNWVLDREGAGLVRAAELRDPRSGRRLTIETTEPGLQVYSGNFLTGAHVGASGTTYRQSDGLALETQHFPNSPNAPGFPPTVLRPGQTFTSLTVLRFAAA